MAVTFTTTRAAARLQGIKVLVHGRAGMGKTMLCATAPRPLIISVEAGLLSLGRLDLPTMVIDSFADLHQAYTFVTTSPHMANIDTICLDSITEIAEQCLATEKARNKDPRKAYGEMQDLMIAWVKAFRDIRGKHVYFSCKTEAVKDDVSGLTLWGPRMPGRQVGPQLPYLFDEVFSLEAARTAEGVPYRYLRTATGMQYEAKDRSGTLDEYERPDLSFIFEKILRAA